MENINWSDLSFGYMKTDYNVRCYYRDGKWGELEVSSSEIINIHMAATCLHYGQESFEGLKAFKGRDGKIRVFRMDENGKRMQSSSRGIKMAELPVEKFEEAIRKVVKLNERFVPPYESGAALYIRPLMIGLGAQVGVKPAPEYMFMIFVTPVGPYFKGGFQPSKVCVLREYDRAAPNGTGTIKVGGNYAASLVAGEIAHSKGYAAVLYLDPKEKKYLDECGPANFFGIRGNSYITASPAWSGYINIFFSDRRRCRYWSFIPGFISSICGVSRIVYADGRRFFVQHVFVLPSAWTKKETAGICCF